MLGLLFLLAGCGDDSSDPGVNSLIGTWHLTTVNGQPIIAGVFVTWVITETTFTATSDLDCTITSTYTINGNMLTGTITSLSGSQCGAQVGDKDTFEFNVSGNTLTIIIIDDDLGTGTFVLTRAN